MIPRIAGGTLVQAQELLDLRGSVRILDASWNMPTEPVTGRQQFEQVHIEGARFFDIDGISELPSSLPHMLPSLKVFTCHLHLLGCEDPEQPIVVYDRMGSLFSAPRVWWTFRAFGRENVSILDGGLSAWIAAGGPTEGSTLPEQCPLIEGPPSWESAPQPCDIAWIDDVRSIVDTNLKNGGAAVGGDVPVIVDVRPADRFYARLPEPRPGVASGHMPGAVNLPFPKFGVGEQPGPDTRWKTPEELRQLFRDASPKGIDLLENQMVASCGSGLTACILAFGAHLAGAKKPVRIYDGSWTEWGSDPTNNPIVKD